MQRGANPSRCQPNKPVQKYIMATLSITRLILLLVGVAGLSACGWVDSTGNQGADKDASSGTEIFSIGFDSGIVLLQEGVPAALTENTASTTQLLNDNSSNGIWSWELSAEGENERCDGINGFDSNVAGNTLLSSCTDPTRCEIQIERASTAAQNDYIVELPRLAAPVALSYLLSGELADGTPVQREQIICAISVNEAPIAIDDNYRTIAGEALNVAGTDANSLLANDSDDIDVRNEPLRVDTRVASAPEYATAFRLQSDGGFSYQPPAQLPRDSGDTLVDSFDYRIGDGLHNVTATATITITMTNEAPIASGNLPDVRFELVENETPTAFTLDVSPFFDSVDNDTLVYSISNEALEELPESLLVQISNSGLLNISIDVKEPAQAVGIWPLQVLASDGLATASSTIIVSVELAPRDTNQAPTVSDIANRTVQGAFEYDISAFFSDPDGDELTFSTQRLPQGVRLSDEGILRGRSNKRNVGAWFIVIEAQDGFGGSVGDGFLLTII